jgi:hypothetical protein
MLGSPSGQTTRCKPMPTRLFTLLLAGVLGLAVAACGSDKPQPAGSSTDTAQLLRDTFANLGKMKSADVNMQLHLTSGQGAVGAQLTGPFVNAGQGRLPKFAFTATLSAAGRSEQLGATWTGEKAFITLQNTPYAVSDLVAKQFVAGYEQSLHSKQSKQAKNGLLLSSLGVDPLKWLQHTRNAGTATVGGTQTVEITGQADIPQMVDDLGRVAKRASSLGLPGTSGGQTQLTPQERAQVEQAIRSVNVQVYTGAQDRMLRRLVLHAVLRDPAAKSDSNLDLDLQLTKVGEDQQISAPAHAKPFAQLLKVTGLLSSGGSLGALLGGTGDTGGASGSGSGSGSSRTNVDKYAKCVAKAKADTAKARKCAALLTG